jgi:hypothetical protein
MTPRTIAVHLLLLGAFAVPASAQAPLRTRNVVLIMLDSLRWQEVFGGADSLLLDREHGGIDDVPAIRSEFWRGSAAERRRAMMPFLWDSLVPRGQILGNAAEGSVARVTNGLNFSYPGYNETLTGAADPRIDTNAYPPNPNITVFEWMATHPGFGGRVAAFGTWDAFPRIFNRDRAGIHVQAAWELPYILTDSSPSGALLNELARTTTRIWDDLAYDSFMQVAVRDYVRVHKPRLLFVGYGETDVWAHDGEYGKLLRSARQSDAFIAELWTLMQAMPEYRDQTTFIVTTDHGRGDGLRAWRDHGSDVPGADRVWIAVIGPDTPAQDAATGGTVTQGQIASTIAALFGEDFRAAFPAAGAPIGAVLPRR